MPKICYLHAGFPKTASSSFQATCRINKDLLQDTGITYPYFTCSANKQRKYNHSYPIISLFTEEPEKKPFNKRLGIVNDIKEVNSAYESQLEGFLSTSADILISGEGIPDLSAQSLSALVDKISSYGYQIKATALIRSPYSALCSTIQQRIKGGIYVDLISFNNSVPNSLDCTPFSKLNMIKKLKSVFGQSIHFHSFERACSHSYGPVGFLLEEFLNQDPSTFEFKKANESLSNLSVRMQNEFNAINPVFLKDKLNPRFKKFPLRVNERLVFSGKFLLTEVEYGLVEEFVKIETENLNELTGLDFSGQSLRFSTPVF